MLSFARVSGLQKNSGQAYVTCGMLGAGGMNSMLICLCGTFHKCVVQIYAFLRVLMSRIPQFKLYIACAIVQTRYQANWHCEGAHTFGWSNIHGSLGAALLLGCTT